MPAPVNNLSELLHFPKSYAFVIGIIHYPLINAHLVSAVPDARAIAKVLIHQQGFDHVELFLGVHPHESQDDLDDGLEEVKVC